VNLKEIVAEIVEFIKMDQETVQNRAIVNAVP